MAGTNSRFDRMIDTMNMTHRIPAKATRRHRPRSIGSSTIGSNLSRTPVDAYEGLRVGPLGKDLVSIEVNTSKAAVSTDDERSSHDASHVRHFDLSLTMSAYNVKSLGSLQ